MARGSRRRQVRKRKAKRPKSADRRPRASEPTTIPRLGYDGIEFRGGPPPFSGMSAEKMDEMVADLADKAEERYQEGLASLTKLIAETSPCRMLAFFALDGLSGKEGDYSPELTDENPVLLHHEANDRPPVAVPEFAKDPTTCAKAARTCFDLASTLLASDAPVEHNLNLSMKALLVLTPDELVEDDLPAGCGQ